MAVELARIDVFRIMQGIPSAFPAVWAVRSILDVNGRQFASMFRFDSEGEAHGFADDAEIVFMASRMLLEQELTYVYISHVVGRCPVCGLPILDDGQSDDPTLWEHSWAQRHS